MRRFSVIIYLIFSCFIGFSQNRAQLEKERLQIIDKIEFITSILKKNVIERENTVEYYNSLQNQIRNREKMLINLKMQISQLNVRIEENAKTLNILKQKIDLLKGKQNKLIRSMYLSTLARNKYIFLFSSQGWEDYLDRKRYLKQYNAYILKSVNDLKKEEDGIRKQINSIEKDKADKENLISAESENLQKIKEESELKSGLLKEMSANEKKYTAQLNSQKRQREELNKSIEEIIIEGLRKIDVNEPTEVQPAASESFSQMKSKLTWPVTNGYISMRFGKHQHPGILGVYINNSGIDLISNPNETVRAIYNGEVAGLMYIDGYNWMVILKHGEYYSVYSKLETVNISKGDKITKNQPLGKISNKGEFHFEIWHLKTKLNPELWLNKSIF
ncbi:MAG: murein hydrolase activator EnvC family protein [Deltaproteobacteria bacterium]